MLEQQLFNALSLGCVYALFALGFTLVFGVLGVVNLSQSAVFIVSAYAALTTLRERRPQPPEGRPPDYPQVRVAPLLSWSSGPGLSHSQGRRRRDGNTAGW